MWISVMLHLHISYNLHNVYHYKTCSVVYPINAQSSSPISLHSMLLAKNIHYVVKCVRKIHSTVDGNALTLKKITVIPRTLNITLITQRKRKKTTWVPT
jgi:hypothetical protein